MFHAAVVGLGNIGLMYDIDDNRVKPSSHLLAYAMNSNIGRIAAFDIRIEQQAFLNKLVPSAVFSSSIKALFEQPVDVVSICSPPQYHLDNIKDILQYGDPKLIFCEKPVVANLNEYQQLKSILISRGIQLIPNLSRRWSNGTRTIKQIINDMTYGKVLKVHARYTRGIYNTGSHLFDLLKLFTGSMNQVKTIQRVPTSADADNDPSYSFIFSTELDVLGHVEAFNDRNYYMFEIDLFFEYGKIEFKLSGDSIIVYGTDLHPLFSGFSHLQEQERFSHLLSESNMAAAVQHLIDVLSIGKEPDCTLEDGMYPIFVAKALLCSANSGNKEIPVNIL